MTTKFHHFWNFGTLGLRARSDGLYDLAYSVVNEEAGDEYDIERGMMIVSGRLDTIGEDRKNGDMFRRAGLTREQIDAIGTACAAIQNLVHPKLQAQMIEDAILFDVAYLKNLLNNKVV